MTMIRDLHIMNAFQRTKYNKLKPGMDPACQMTLKRMLDRLAHAGLAKISGGTGGSMGEQCVDSDSDSPPWPEFDITSENCFDTCPLAVSIGQPPLVLRGRQQSTTQRRSRPRSTSTIPHPSDADEDDMDFDVTVSLQVRFAVGWVCNAAPCITPVLLFVALLRWLLGRVLTV